VKKSPHKLALTGLILDSDAARKPTESQGDDRESASSLLRRAIQYFSEAKGLVLAQEKLHARMNAQDMSEDTRFYRRNLLLLRGRAQVNTGIATVEQAMHCYSDRDQARQVQLKLACKELDAAVVSSKAMQSQSVEDGSNGCSPSETTLDVFCAQQLESLSHRWKATALWHLYQRDDAFHSFSEAASVFQSPASFTVTSTDPEVLDVALECRAECYHAWRTLADLASRSLERGTVKLIRESPSFYDKIHGFVTTAMTNAADASKVIETELRGIPDKYTQVCNQHGVLEASELLQSLKEYQAWWKRRKEAASRPIVVPAAARPLASSLPRSDLLGDGDLPNSEALPTQRFVLKPRTRRSKYNLGGTGFSNVGVSSHALEEPVVTPRAPPRRYRKWCEDEYDEATGQMVAKLVYPSIAPPMPPHIAAILAARRGQESNQQ